jgi:CBS domain-containing protein
MHDIADFLSRHPPFDRLDEGELARVAARAEIEFFPADALVIDDPEAVLDFGFVVRRGPVELLIEGRLLDLMGEGELFGFVSLLSEDPPGFVARAAEDTLVYRIPAEVLRPVLERPAFVRYLTRVMNERVRFLAEDVTEPTLFSAGRPVGELIRAPALLRPPATTVQDAARQMADAGTTCVVVELADGLGIVTDRDIRTRVVAAGAGPETPLSDVMTAPAWTVSADRTATEALLEMLEQGIRHLPVLSADRRLLGVLDDVDLMANERRAPFRLRAAIQRGGDARAVAHAAAGLRDTVIALYDAGLPSSAMSRAIASIHDAVTRRMIEFAHQDLGDPPVPYTWLATGSFGRFEPFPSSDVDSAMVWDGPDDDPEVRRCMGDLAEYVLTGVKTCGFEPDTKGAVASSPLFSRSVEEWERAARTWVEDPDRDRGLLLLSVVVESDAVWGSTAMADHVTRAFVEVPDRRLLLRRLAEAAVAVRPPTGFIRDFVLHTTGERRGILDIKRGGLLPVESLARWSGLRAAVSAASTRARLKASLEAGTLRRDDAANLRDAFELFSALRMEHQVVQLREEAEPDDLIEPRSLAPLARTSLKEAFRAVGRVQRAVANEYGLNLL